MLVLSRRKGQAIVLEIGSLRVKVVVVESAAGGRVKLGVEADKEVKVLREELLEKDKGK